MYPPTYLDVYNVIAKWIEEDKLWPEYKKCVRAPGYNALDVAILNAFGIFNINEFPCYLGSRSFEQAVKVGDIKIDWIVGPHGLALFKALLSRIDNRMLKNASVLDL